jgi:hypothetical protein
MTVKYKVSEVFKDKTAFSQELVKAKFIRLLQLLMKRV